MYLCIMLPKMSTYTRNFDDTRYMFFFIKDNELLENIMKFGIKSVRLFKKNLIVSLYTIKSI